MPQLNLPELSGLVEDLLSRIRFRAARAAEPVSQLEPRLPLEGVITQTHRIAPEIQDIPRFETTSPLLKPRLEDEPALERLDTERFGFPTISRDQKLPPLPAYPDYGPPDVSLPAGVDRASLPRIPLGGSFAERLADMRSGDYIPRVQPAQDLPESIRGLEDNPEAADILSKLRALVSDTPDTHHARSVADVLNTPEGGGISANDFRALVDGLNQVSGDKQLGPGTALARLRLAGSAAVPEERVQFNNSIGSIDEASPDYLRALKLNQARRVQDIINARVAEGKPLPSGKGLKQFEDNPIKQTSWGLQESSINPARLSPTRPDIPQDIFEAAKGGKIGSVMLPHDVVRSQGIAKGQYVIIQDPHTKEEMLVRISGISKPFAMDESMPKLQPNQAALTEMAFRQGMTPDATKAWLSKMTVNPATAKPRALVEVAWERPQSGPEVQPKGLTTMQTIQDRSIGKKMAPGEDMVRFNEKPVKAYTSGDIYARRARVPSDRLNTGTDIPLESYMAKETPPDAPLPEPGRPSEDRIVVADARLLAQMAEQEGKPAAARAPYNQNEGFGPTKSQIVVGNKRYNAPSPEPAEARVRIVPEEGKQTTVALSEVRNPKFSSAEQENIRRSDATLAISLNHNDDRSAQLTRFASASGKPVISLTPNKANIEKDAAAIVAQLNKVATPSTQRVLSSTARYAQRPLVLNISGNDVKALAEAALQKTGQRYEAADLQQRMNDYMQNLLEAIQRNPDRKFEIGTIRSTGDTGASVAAIRAAARLGVGAKIHSNTLKPGLVRQRLPKKS